MSEELGRRRRRRTINQLQVDWVKIGAKMLAAEAKDPRRATQIRISIAADAGLSEAVARRVRRMADDLAFIAKRDGSFADSLHSFTITAAEILLRWARADLQGARKAAADFAAGRHTALSLMESEREARHRVRPGASAPSILIERDVIARLAEDPRFEGWTFRRISKEQDFRSAGLDPDLMAAGVDVIATPPADGAARLVLIFHSALPRQDAQFQRLMKSAAWAASGVAAHTGLEVIIAIVAPSRYASVEELIGRLGNRQRLLLLHFEPHEFRGAER
jgi:hypothetical protein